MKQAHSVAVVRAAEAAAMAGLPDGALMDRAAAGLATVCLGLLGRAYGSRVVLLVGSGDNGGDALYAGARMAGRGVGVDALLLAPERAHPGGLAALRQAGGRVTEDAAVLDRADLVLDGIVGIGGSGGLRPAAAELVARAARGPGLTVAVDLPSGVDADTGEVNGAAVRADATVTFGTWKPGLLIDPGAGLAGATTLIDIGLGPHLPDATVTSLQADDVAAVLPMPGREADKYRRGVLGVVAGSPRYVGAAVLAVGGALAAGAGMVRFVGPSAVADAVRTRHPEVVVSDGLPSAAGQVQAWVVGPGGGTDETARAVLNDVLGSDVPVLVDADGLSLLAQQGELRRRATTLLTPHAGELGRLLGVERGTVEAQRLLHVQRAAHRYGATVLLKGSTTLIAGQENDPVRVNGTGTGWLGTAGSGDVLSGACGALLAAGLPGDLAGAVGAHLHGLAGRLAAGSGAPITAGRITDLLAEAWRSVAPGDR